MTDIEITREPGESQLHYMQRRAALLDMRITRTPPEKPEVKPIWDESLIPDIGVERNPEQYEIDHVLGRVDVLDAYVRWCNKMVPNSKDKRESIMVSCPNPRHPDHNPSAWLNLDKGDGGVGYCPGCEMGFDKYDIAAWRFGFDVPGYKGKDFPELRISMAEDLGYRAMVRGKDIWLEKVQPKDVDTAPHGVNKESPTITPVVGLAGGEEGAGVVPELRVDGTAISSDVDSLSSPSPVFVPTVVELNLDWRNLPIMENVTFLSEWMDATSQSYEPEEFYFWEGMMMIGSACGNNVFYPDTMPVRPNFMVCLVGTTGSGKTIAMHLMESLLRQALPFKPDTGGGVRNIASPGSGEALVDQFNHFTTDLTTKEKTFYPINGVYREAELATLVKRASRNGNTIRENLMDLYDTKNPVTIFSRGGGSVTATDHFMQMITSTQPSAINTLLSKEDAGAGFLNRWVYVIGTSKTRPAIDEISVDVTPMIPSLQKIRAWASATRRIGFINDEARESWIEFHTRNIAPLAKSEDPMISRLPLLAKKILVVLACNDMTSTITWQHVETLKLMWPYLASCYGVVGDNIGLGELQACTNGIEKYMSLRSDQAITVRQLKMQSSARKYPDDIILRSLEMMVKLSFIEEVSRSKTDRVVRYKYLVHSERPLATVTSIR